MSPEEREAYGRGQRTAAGDASKASQKAGPGYNWSSTSGNWTDPDTGYIYFGGAGPGAYTRNTGVAYDKNYMLDYNLGNQVGAGYIDPHTGNITYTTKAGTYGPSTGYDPSKDAQRNSRMYDYQSDYGLGPQNVGIIPIAHDAHGTPTAFYAGTQGGGGQVFNTLEEAQAAVQQYAQWYPTQHPNSSPTTAPTENTPSAPGLLTTPGAGEDWWTQHQKEFEGPTNAQKALDGAKYDQPTNAEQYWQKYNGIFSDPNYMDDYYGRQKQVAQTTLNRRASSVGVGDSSAAARATGNLDLLYSDAARKAKQDWATTGGALAQAADTAHQQSIAGQNSIINTAENVDSGNLAQLVAGGNAAATAQGLQQSRLTGALTSAITLGSAEGQMTFAGLSALEQQSFLTQMQALALQADSGKISYQQAYQQGMELLQSISTMGKAAGSMSGKKN